MKNEVAISEVNEINLVDTAGLSDTNMGLGVIMLAAAFIGVWAVFGLLVAVFNFGIVPVAQAFLLSIGL